MRDAHRLQVSLTKSFNLQQYSNHTTLPIHFCFRLKTICTFICWIKEMQFHLKNTLTNLGMILLLSFFTGHQPGGLDELASLFPVPLKVPVNTKASYFINPLTGDSIEPIINSLGDILRTGVPCWQPKPVQALPPRMKDMASRNIKFLDVEQGMNSTYVMSGLEDNHGNLWFGTWGGGVNVYNGESFTHFTEQGGWSYPPPGKYYPDLPPVQLYNVIHDPSEKYNVCRLNIRK